MEDSDRLLELKNKLTNMDNYCPEQFVYLCTILSCLVSGFTILGHLWYYNEPNLQKNIIRILFMIPVYSMATLGSIVNEEHSLIYAAIRDFYEAYVLYTFMQLLIHYLGGYKLLTVHLEFKVSSLNLNSSNCNVETNSSALAI